MINAIGEATIQQAIRVNHNNSINGKVTVEVKAEQMIKERPVEKTGDSTKSEMDLQHNLDTTTRHTIDEKGKIIFERYDADGKLIRKIPPGYVPFCEMI
jgi:hypothetical protein